MFNKRFWKLAMERAIKSFAQTFVAILGVQSTLIEDAPWYTAASTAALAFVLSVLTSIGSANIGPDGDPSMVSPRSDSVGSTGAAPVAAQA
jgi:hypothetical protein